jgi:hypothetical protein
MNTVTINNKQLPAVEYRGQRVVTLAMIDEVHQRPEGTARTHFRNREHLSRCGLCELGADVIRRTFLKVLSLNLHHQELCFSNQVI